MPIFVEITDRSGSRSTTVDADVFWIGTTPNCEVQVDVPDTHARILEVRLDEVNGVEIRAEPGLPFPVRCATGNVGSRFQSMIEGDLLNAGPAMVRLKALSPDGVGALEEIDLSDVRSAGAPVGPWYDTFMEVADHLEGLKDPARMIDAALDAVLVATGADRVHLALEPGAGLPDGRTAFHRQRGEAGDKPFRVSSNLVQRVREAGKVVHVPVAADDPVASRFVSVRREGISSGIALPLSALGSHLGVLYADCVRDGAVLSAEDLQRVAFITRLLASALGNRALVATLVRREPGRDSDQHWALRSQAPACAEMIERVKLYAPTDYTVLLRGETGSGKEVIAQAIHELSRRREGPFVPVNCAAIPEQLMESMLFGHEKGAFTGAMQTREGHFKEADGGTLFLDEIGDMALDLQAKILRVLQDRMVTPVGATRRVPVDVRILAATHQDLETMVGERRFREDLYYRLRELEILLPPLRDRREDLLMLCARFLEEARDELGLEETPELATETLDHLQQRRWRGNIRELRHTIKGAALRAAGGVIKVVHLDASPRAPGTGVDPVGGGATFAAGGGDSGAGTWKERLEAQERAALEETLRQADGNLTRAARLFGVPRTTYREKLVKAGLLDADSK